jgi:YfiH family protein
MRKFSYIAPDWPAPSNVRAASTFRTGGVSREPYDELNLAAHVGDDPPSVAENRRLLRVALHLPDEPSWLEQVHGDRVVESNRWSQPPRADACVARTQGSICAILTADCLPVLFCSRDGDRVAAAHAGWRGLAAGVLDNTVGALGLPGSEVIAWLGPAISQSAYEVGDDVRIACMARDTGFGEAFVQNARGRWQCDLYALARRNLYALGIKDVYGGEYCTSTDEDRFFSYRRDGQCGRTATLVWIAA